MPKPKKGIHGTPVENCSVSGLGSLLLSDRTKDLNPSEGMSFREDLTTKDLPVFFHPPFLLPDLYGATETFSRALESGQKILLYGDRDTDGVTSTSLLYLFVKKFYPKANIEAITSTQNDPYGLGREALSRIKNSKPHLLVTLDFGTSNLSEIQELHSRGIETIIIDHHETLNKLPPGYLVNPKREDSLYPNRKICTAALAMKFCTALLFCKTLEFNRVYRITDDSNSQKPTCFRNGVIWDPGTDSDGMVVTELNREKLPGGDFHPLGSRVFHYQLKMLPDILPFQYEAAALAGIGTITDMMPLLGENRALVSYACHSLEALTRNPDPLFLGLKSLLESISLVGKKITAKDLGWAVGPILNAAGRMGKTELATDLLFALDQSKASEMSQALIKTNEERKERTKRNLHKTDLYFKRHPEYTQEPLIFCYEPDLEPGVSGIVATKLVDTYHKPAIFVTPDHGQARGSIRSYEFENVLDLLKTADDILDQYGGHPEAGGFSVAIDRIPLLRERLLACAKPWLVEQSQKPRSIRSDLLCRPEDLTDRFLIELEKLEPTGQANPPVLLSLKDVKPLYFQFMGDGKHARFRIMGAGSLKFLIWNEAETLSRYLSSEPSLSLWGYLESNYFQGKSSLQFVVSYFE